MPHRVCRKCQQASQNQLRELEKNHHLVISHKMAMLETDTQMRQLVAKQEMNHRERQALHLTSRLQQKERKRLQAKTVSQSQQHRRKQNQQEKQSKEAMSHREALLKQDKEEKRMQQSEGKTIKCDRLERTISRPFPRQAQMEAMSHRLCQKA